MKNQEDIESPDALATELCSRAMDGFWKGVKHINQCSSLNVLDGVSGEMDISNYWNDHFYKMLNTNQCI